MTIMDEEGVLACVEVIRAQAGDPEAAHASEDELHQAVLQSIADGTCPDPAASARAALTTIGIDFSRWYA